VDWSVHYPNSEIGKRFCQFFQARFNFIEAEVPREKPDGKNPLEKPHKKPSWKTISEYPIQHINLWRRFNSDHHLIGLSFDKTTNYFLIDIDINSPYHPLNDELTFRKLLGAYEDIGFNKYLLVQSSWSEGVHVYFPLPKELSTYELAETVKFIAIKEGFRVKDGWLEFFPNAKAYNPDKPTAYRAHRLPLQPNTGSYLLDDDYQPYSEDIAVFLEQAESVAASQDIDLIKTAILAAKRVKEFRHIKGDGGKAARFASDLKEQIEEGWTGFSQTNDLLRIIGTYGRVFEGLEGRDLANYIAETAKESQGYHRYCRHQHHIHQRAKDWAKCIEKFYYPYGSKPSRVGKFAQMVKEGSKENKVNDSRQFEAKERIKKAVEHLKTNLQRLPKKVGQMKEALLKALSELFNTHSSNTTLDKYKDLWHPKFVQVEEEPQTESTASPSTETSSIETLPKETPSMESERETESADVIHVEPLLEEYDKSSHTPPDVVPKKSRQEKQLESIKDKDSEKKPTPPLYMKVKDWAKNKIPLTYLGNSVGGLVETKKEKRNKLKSIPPGEKVIITDYNHSSFLFHPEDLNNLLVYVCPISEIDNWIAGVAVKVINLKPT